MLTNVLHLRFIHLYLRFKGGGDEERYRVEQKQYFKPRMLIAPRRRKHHNRRQREYHAGYGICLGGKAGRYKHWIQAVVCHLIYAVHRADYKAKYKHGCIVEYIKLQHNEYDKIQRGRYEIQRIYCFCAGKTVKIRPCKERHNHLGQIVHYVEYGVKQRGARIVQHQQAYCKARHGVAQRADDRA